MLYKLVYTLPMYLLPSHKPHVKFADPFYHTDTWIKSLLHTKQNGDWCFIAIIYIDRYCGTRKWYLRYGQIMTFYGILRDVITYQCSRYLFWYLGLYSLSGKTSYRKISWSLEAARFGFKLFQSLWNLAGTSAALLPRCLSNFRAIRPLQHPISRLRDFTRFGPSISHFKLWPRSVCF